MVEYGSSSSTFRFFASRSSLSSDTSSDPVASFSAFLTTARSSEVQ